MNYYDRYWMPQYRWQVAEWLCERYPQDKVRFSKMRKGQLMRIYRSVRDKEMSR